MAKNSGERILVADDDATSRKLLIRILTRAGFACTEAPDGIEALKLLRVDPPALLLLDFDMPGMDGAEVLKHLRQDDNAMIAQIPAIMLTGHGGEESEVLCLEAGADDFVTKPINDAVLRARIDTQLRLRSMRSQLQKQNDELEAWRHNLERDLEAARLTQQSLIPQKPAGRTRDGKLRLVIGRSSRWEGISMAGCGWEMAAPSSGSRTRPAMEHRRRC